MISIGTTAPLLGHALLLAVAAAWLLRRFELPPWARVAVVVITCGFVLWPIGDLPVAAYLRGAFGDLSIPMLCLLLGGVASFIRGRTLIAPNERDAVTTFTLAAAAILYPLALGIGYFDPYALGYSALPFAAALFLIALVTWYARLYVLTVCVALAATAYAHDLLESRNLWDYLIDPLLVFYALFTRGNVLLRRASNNAKKAQNLCKRAYRRLRRKDPPVHNLVTESTTESTVVDTPHHL